MAIISTTLVPGPSNIYVSSGNTVVSVMYFCNQSSYSSNLRIYVVSNGSVAGGSVTSANLIYNEVIIAPTDTFVVDLEKLVLSPGDYISASSGPSGNVTTATVSYVGI